MHCKLEQFVLIRGPWAIIISSISFPPLRASKVQKSKMREWHGKRLSKTWLNP